MDDQATSSAARRGPDIPAGADEREAEIARLRERLGFYESFDRLIQENVSRAGQLLREAAETRSTADQRRIAAQADHRALLSGLLDEVSAVQGHVERLARRVAEALDAVEGDLPAGAATRSVTGSKEPTTESAGADRPTFGASVVEVDVQAPEAVAAEAGEEGTTELDPAALFDGPPSTADEAPTPSAAAEPPAATDAAHAEGVPPEMPREPDAPAVDDPERFELETSGTPDVAESASASVPQPEMRSEESADALPPTTPSLPTMADVEAAPEPAESAGAGAATVVLVHGVPRATTALSLKRYLEGLSHVETVEPREYAEGVLRLQVTSARPLLFDDLRGWAEAAALEPIHERDDLVEVRMGK